MQRAIDFLASIWRVIVAALGFRDDLLAGTAREPQSERVILAILLLTGMSFLVGQSAILSINQVSPFWFALTLVLSALLFVVRFAPWSAAIWFLSESLFCTRRALGPLIRVLGVGSAPFVFGAVILLPYLGPFIARALAVWSFLIVLHAVRYATGIGVHLNLTDGLPLSPPSAVSSLVDRAGRFRAFPTQLLRVVGGHARLTEVECEFRAQIEYLLARGVAPTHLDGHMHVHALPRFLPLVLCLMNEYGIRGMRQPVLSARAPLYRDARRAARGQRARRKHSQRQQMRTRWGATARHSWASVTTDLSRCGGKAALVARSRATTVDFLLDAATFLNGADPAGALGIALGGIRGGRVELMAHPGFSDDPARRSGGYAADRAAPAPPT